MRCESFGYGQKKSLKTRTSRSGVKNERVRPRMKRFWSCLLDCLKKMKKQIRSVWNVQLLADLMVLLLRRPRGNFFKSQVHLCRVDFLQPHLCNFSTSLQKPYSSAILFLSLPQGLEDRVDDPGDRQKAKGVLDFGHRIEQNAFNVHRRPGHGKKSLHPQKSA